jgi:putative polyketide hydroxylase
MLVERHPGTSVHPKARGVNVRTMELFREWGIEDTVRSAGLPAESYGFFYRGSSLLSPTFERTGGGGMAVDAQTLSPSTWIIISQDTLEPLLLARARQLRRCDIRFQHELVAVEADGDGARAIVLDRRGDREITIRATYVVGADGSKSPVRESLGIPLSGLGPLVHNLSVLFEAQLTELIADRRSAVYFFSDDPQLRPRGYPMSVGNPPPDGVMLTVDDADRWLLVIGVDDDNQANLDPEMWATKIARAIGRDDIPIRIISTMPWSPAALVAARYREGFGFLAGDAAHQMTPLGAFGLNVGIQDAHNIGWKLGAVLGGWAGRGLLDTYDAERRPTGLFATEQSYQQFAGTKAPRPFGNWGVILGAGYASQAIIPDETAQPRLADPAVDYIPRARPGFRAPHLWLRREGRRISSLDLYGGRLVCIAGKDADDWIRGVHVVSDRSKIPIDALQVGRSFEVEDATEFEESYEIGDRGAVLIRPDGHVAWRTASPPSRTGPSIETVVRRVVGFDDVEWASGSADGQSDDRSSPRRTKPGLGGRPS